MTGKAFKSPAQLSGDLSGDLELLDRPSQTALEGPAGLGGPTHGGPQRTYRRGSCPSLSLYSSQSPTGRIKPFEAGWNGYAPTHTRLQLTGKIIPLELQLGDDVDFVFKSHLVSSKRKTAGKAL